MEGGRQLGFEFIARDRTSITIRMLGDEVSYPLQAHNVKVYQSIQIPPAVASHDLVSASNSQDRKLRDMSCSIPTQGPGLRPVFMLSCASCQIESTLVTKALLLLCRLLMSGLATCVLGLLCSWSTVRVVRQRALGSQGLCRCRAGCV